MSTSSRSRGIGPTGGTAPSTSRISWWCRGSSTRTCTWRSVAGARQRLADLRAGSPRSSTRSATHRLLRIRDSTTPARSWPRVLARASGSDQGGVCEFTGIGSPVGRRSSANVSGQRGRRRGPDQTVRRVPPEASAIPRATSCRTRSPGQRRGVHRLGRKVVRHAISSGGRCAPRCALAWTGWHAATWTPLQRATCERATCS